MRDTTLKSVLLLAIAGLAIGCGKEEVKDQTAKQPSLPPVFGRYVPDKTPSDKPVGNPSDSIGDAPVAQSTGVGFATPDEAMDEYVKLIVALDLARYKDYFAHDSMTQQYPEALVKAGIGPGASEEFKWRVALNDTRKEWLDNNAKRFPAQIDGNTATITVVMIEHNMIDTERKFHKYQFKKTNLGWQLVSDNEVGRYDRLSPAMELRGGKAVISATSDLPPIRDKVAWVKPTPEAARTAIREFDLREKLNDTGQIVELGSYSPIDMVKLPSVLALASPQLKSLSLGTTSKTKRLDEAYMAELSRITGLEELKIFSDYISVKGTAPLATLASLKALTIRSVHLTDNSIAPVGKLANLESLSLNNGLISDVGLAHLKGLSGLKKLSLGGNNIQGPGLQSLDGLHELEVLDLSDNDLIGPGLVSLTKFPTLKVLSLRASNFDDVSAAELDDIYGLDYLYLQDTLITDDALAHLKNLSNLKYLFLERNQINGSGLKHLTGLTNLETLKLTECPLAEEALQHLAKMTNLKELEFTVEESWSPDAVANLKNALPETSVVAVPPRKRYD